MRWLDDERAGECPVICAWNAEENDENFNGTVDVLSNNTHFDTDGKERGMFSGYRAGTAI